MSFEAYFEELKTGGTLDSTGVFTLNVEKLQGKLAQYQLANPREYAQFLVRAACAGGARRLSSTFVPQQSRIEIEGLHFRLEHFQNFSFQRPASAREEAAHYVAIALSAAAKLGAVKILVGKGGRGFCISSNDGKLEFNEDEATASRLNGIVFEVTGFFHENPVNKLVPSARWSEVPHQPDHFEIARSDLFGEVYAAATTRRFRLSPRALTYPVRIEFSSMDAPDLLLLFWSKHEPLAAPNVRGVHRGISYPMPNIPLPRGFHAVVRADDLKPDLSYGGLVEDEAYQAKGKMLRGLVFRVLEKVVEAEVEWNEEQVEEIRQKLDLYWPRSRVTDSLRKFYKRNFTTMLPGSPQAMTRFVSQLECLPPEDIKECLDDYQPRISQIRSKSSTSALGEMKTEGELRRRLDLLTPDFLHREALFELIYEGKRSNRGDLAELPAVEQIIPLAVGEEEVDEQVLKQLEIDDTWREFFLFFLLLERNEEKRIEALASRTTQSILPFTLFLSRGRCREALAFAAERRPELSVYPTCWHTLALKFGKGKISWTEQIRLMARSRLGRTAIEGLILEESQDPSLGRHLVERLVFDSAFFWPTLIYYVLLQKRRGESALPLLFRLYLQSLLGEPGSTRTVSEMCRAPLRLPLV